MELLAIGEEMGWPRIAFGPDRYIRSGQGQWELYASKGETKFLPAAIRVARIHLQNLRSNASVAVMERPLVATITGPSGNVIGTATVTAADLGWEPPLDPDPEPQPEPANPEDDLVALLSGPPPRRTLGRRKKS